MDQQQKNEILEKAKSWWRDELAVAHEANTLKLKSVKEFDINPFLWSYLAYYFEGNNTAESLAKVLIYPRVLGQSITTSFGTQSQRFVTKVFEGVLGSTTPGIDLEFEDKIDGRRKYCQLKAGPNVINKDDVEPIKEHFRSAVRQARTNSLDLNTNDFMLCLLYGEPYQKNAHIRNIEKDFVVMIGSEFWHRFTGDSEFYADLISAIGEVAAEFDMKQIVADTVQRLSKDIEDKYPDVVK